MIACPSCGFEALDDFAFCPKCGRALVRPLASTEERKTVTTLICDLVAFTAMSEAADPEDVDAVLREYHAAARKVIESHGGTVEKFIGDAVVGVFGVPAVHEDDPERAVRAGLRLLEAFEGMTRPDGTPLQVRVGVNTGEALVRLDVTPGSGEGFLTGDSVNVAARLQAAAPPMGVVVGEMTYSLTVDSIDYEPCGQIVAKGKSAPVRAWQAKAARARTGADPARADLTPLVGREADLAAVRALFEMAAGASSPQVVLLVGEPGVGKSRLVVELYRWIDDRKELVTWRQGVCPPYGDGVTFWALGQIVKAQAGILDSDDPGVAGARLDAIVPPGPDREWMRNRLRPLVGLPAPEATREENFAAWLRFLEGLASVRPAVVVFEDLHAADEALLDFLEYFAGHVDAVPLLVVGTARPELFDRRPDFGASVGRLQRIELEPLSSDQTTRLVAGLAEAVGVPRGVVEVIAERCAGNPFYAEESVRLLGDTAILQAHAPGPVVRDVGEHFVPVPGSVQAVIAARLDALDPALKAVLADASVVGGVFWSGAVAALEEREESTVDDAVERLIARQMVRRVSSSSMEGESEFTFWHALTRDVSYSQLPRAARARKHLATGSWIESKAGDRVENLAEILAHHYVTALELATALEDRAMMAAVAGPAGHHLAVSGEHIFRLDVVSAQRYFARALELLPPAGLERGKTLYRQAEAFCFAGRPVEGVEALDESARVLREAGDTNGAACSLIESGMWGATAGDPGWRVRFDEGVGLCDLDEPTPELVRALQETAAARASRLRDFAGAVEAADGALRVAGQLGLPAPAEAFEWRGEGRACLGDAGWLEDYERAIELGESQGLGGAMVRAYHNHANALETQTGPRGALEAMRANVEFARRRGMEFWVLVGRCGAVGLLLSSGEWAAAQEEAADLVPLAVESGWGEALATVSAPQALLLAARGEAIDSARASELAAWLPEQGRSGAFDPLLSATCLVAAAALRHALGKVDEVGPLLASCLEGPGLGRWGASCEGVRTGLLPHAVRLALAVGDIDLGQRFRTAARPLTPVDEHGLVSADALLTEGRGEWEAAASGFADAAARWHCFGVPYEEAQALLGQGRCLVALGRASAAAALLAAAGEIFARLVARPAVEETDELRRQVASA